MSIFDDIGESLGGLVVADDDALVKALPGPPVKKEVAAEYDAYEALMWSQYEDATGGLGLEYHTRAAMASAPQVAPIISTRIRQVSKFAQVPETKYGYGYRVILRDRDAPPSKAAKKEAMEFERLIATCGHLRDEEDLYKRPMFPQFLAAYVRDSLVHDQRNAEFVMDRAGRPSYFKARDCTTIRRARPKRIEHGKSQNNDGSVGMMATAKLIMPAKPYVQVIKGRMVAEFDYKQMSWGVRRPRTDIRARGYGFSELDELVTVITALLWSLDYNANYFRQGSTTKGIINIVGAMPKDQLRSFKRMWAMMVSGVSNAWRTPIVNTPAQGGALQWIPLGQSNKDMEWAAFTEWLTYLVASAYGMDVAELGARYSGAKGQKAMFETDGEAKIRASQERGLDPLLKGVASDLNKHFIWPNNSDFELMFVGLDQRGEADRIGLDKQRMSFMTMNEIRANHDLEPLEGGDMVDNQIWFQQESQKKQEEQMAAQMGQQQGPPQEEGAPPPEAEAPKEEAPPPEAEAPKEEASPPEEPQKEMPLGKGLRRVVTEWEL